MNETGSILNTGCISGRVGTVKCKMELEVGEILFKLHEIVQVEHLIQGTGSIEVVHHTVAGLESLCHPHDLRTERSHTGTTTYPHHLSLGIYYRVEVAIRSAHAHLVAGFESEYVA